MNDQPESTAIAIPEQTMLSVIERIATDPNADVDKLDRLLDMQERVLAREARVAFNAAFSEMQHEIPTVIERGKTNNGKYATLEDINEEIRPILQKWGFGILFRIKQTDSDIAVTGVLSHKTGHCEETTISLPRDTSGSKNNVQAVGSSTSYGKRYVLCALLNISTRGEDDDGRSSTAAKMVTTTMAETLRDILMECNSTTREWFMTQYGSVNSVPRDKYDALLAKLKAARDKAAKGGSDAAANN